MEAKLRVHVLVQRRHEGLGMSVDTVTETRAWALPCGRGGEGAGMGSLSKAWSVSLWCAHLEIPLSKEYKFLCPSQKTEKASPKFNSSMIFKCPITEKNFNAST